MYGFTAEFLMDNRRVDISDVTGTTLISYPVLYDSLYAIYEVRDSGWKKIGQTDDREDLERIAFQHFINK